MEANDSNNNTNLGWSKWVIGALSTLSFLFGTLYISNVNAQVEDLRRSNIELTSQVYSQNQRLTVQEAQMLTLRESITQMRSDMREVRDAVIKGFKDAAPGS